MQYKKEVELMLDIARSYIKPKTSASEIDVVAAPPSVVQENNNTAITS